MAEALYFVVGAIPLLLFYGGLLAACVAITNRTRRRVLNRWAMANEYTILQADYRLLRRGPLYLEK
jgi:hypothetical protein